VLVAAAKEHFIMETETATPICLMYVAIFENEKAISESSIKEASLPST